jgi:hypothetical protein
MLPLDDLLPGLFDGIFQATQAFKATVASLAVRRGMTCRHNRSAAVCCTSKPLVQIHCLAYLLPLELGDEHFCEQEHSGLKACNSALYLAANGSADLGMSRALDKFSYPEHGGGLCYDGGLWGVQFPLASFGIGLTQLLVYRPEVAPMESGRGGLGGGRRPLFGIAVDLVLVVE